STNHNGIAITIPEAGTHQIRITPHSCPFTAGWGNAFGYKNDNTGNANTAANKQKLISIDAPLTTMAFAPKESESTTSASWMFANMFSGCTNLTTPAKIADTYKLPKKITDLSYFLHSTHAYNTELKAPIDLSGLEGWLDGNENITRMNGFLGSTHYNNTELKAPIDLTPLAGWFKENESIMNLAQFLAYTHIDNIALEAPIDLSPLEDWFDGNESITDLSSFLYGTHRTNTNPNTNLEAPIDLSQLKDWFDCNESITNIGSFLYHTHYNNTKLKAAINLTHLSGWFDTAGRSITTNGFLYHTHYNNISLNLTGQKIFPNWIKTLKQGTAETPIKDVTSAFERMFSCEQEKSDDTAEPEFEDGTVLSSLGVPSNPSNKRTYTNRNISPVNDGWK
ncbi:MAG: hypothetical protein LBS54_07550, partial [Dysgonamonadaceae bacterium]|nr:hypothetical protein [Dysgonamonadaceae bacterium]